MVVYNVMGGRSTAQPKNLDWIYPMSNQQQGGYECGYYVMNWMLDIIEGEVTNDWIENEEGSDVTFSVGGERFHAHKLVLAARSTTFETEFFNGMEEDDRDIVVTDMEPKVFKALLHFIYRDPLIHDEELFTS
ncbi:BTB/POZ and MATH domain-containing protein 4-like [Cajanus cajan]|uniref:BTB/POZ and MATH domain-containing protein 4-like n=1 Tax=Cajanus cajan TaxID=3821 RepID=UPI0010FAD611|nr:BTB/POZ and MATH domain-containing protein 4-like [Cajanus cajan]